jgi:hypothetical protein
MAPRKYESGHQKKGALEKFVTSNKQNITEK